MYANAIRLPVLFKVPSFKNGEFFSFFPYNCSSLCLLTPGFCERTELIGNEHAEGESTVFGIHEGR